MKRTLAVLFFTVLGAAAIATLWKPAPIADPDVSRFEPKWEQRLGAWVGSAIAVPESASVGVPATITISTENPDTCIRSGGTEVRMADFTAVIRPHDMIGTGMECGAAITRVRHDTTVTFTRRGVATVRVERSNGAPLERRVVVR